VTEETTELTREQRDRAVLRVLLIEFLLNLIVAGAKGAYGILTGSLTITADAIHSTVDASANILGIAVLKKSAEPPDHSHPYGHRKFEVLGATALGLVIAVVGVNFGIAAVDSMLSERQAPQTGPLGLVVILGTLVINIFVAAYESRQAKRLNSAYLEADAAHTASDVIVTIAVLVSFGASHLGYGWADEIGALFVVAVILRIAWTIVRSNLSALLDEAQGNVKEIESVVLSIEGIEDCHRVRSHGTPHAIIVDLHAQADGDLTLAESHELAHQIEDALYEADERIVDVTVHMEPAGDPVDEL
jgi:cation diffusion facilitator family transporter